MHGARLDVVVDGFWGGIFERTYLDVRVFNPLAPSNQKRSMYRSHEKGKKRQYEPIVRKVETMAEVQYFFLFIEVMHHVHSRSKVIRKQLRRPARSDCRPDNC